MSKKIEKGPIEFLDDEENHWRRIVANSRLLDPRLHRLADSPRRHLARLVRDASPEQDPNRDLTITLEKLMHLESFRRGFTPRDALPYAQQAYIGVLRYGHQLPWVSVLRHLDITKMENNQDIGYFIDIASQAHATLHPHGLQPTWRGTIALGMLRVERDPGERARIADVLVQDQIGREIYEAHTRLYSEDLVTSEVDELRALLQTPSDPTDNDPTKDINSLLRLYVPAFHLEHWGLQDIIGQE